MRWSKFDRGLTMYERVGAVVGTTVVVVAAVSWTLVKVRRYDVPAWLLIAEAVLLVLLVGAGYVLSRRRKVAAPPDAGQRALAELEVANNYIKHVRDFMEGLRLSGVGLPPAEAVPKLKQLRELVFDAIIQGINRRPGDHIRCALFAPGEDEDGTAILRVREHRGHTHRVDNLKLHMSSVAGIAFTSREPLYVTDAEADPRVERTAAGRVVKTLYCLPLHMFGAHRRDPVGVFSVASNRAAAFSESDRAFISACADMVAVVEFFITLWENMPTALVKPPPVPPSQLGAALVEHRTKDQDA